MLTSNYPRSDANMQKKAVNIKQKAGTKNRLQYIWHSYTNSVTNISSICNK